LTYKKDTRVSNRKKILFYLSLLLSQSVIHHSLLTNSTIQEKKGIERWEDRKKKELRDGTTGEELGNNFNPDYLRLSLCGHLSTIWLL
jgi:hypothetical protein